MRNLFFLLPLTLTTACSSGTVDHYIDSAMATMQVDGADVPAGAVSGGSDNLPDFIVTPNTEWNLGIELTTTSITADFAALVAAFGGKPLDELDGTELSVGQVLTAQGELYPTTSTTPTASLSLEYVVTQYGKPGAPMDLSEGFVPGAPFLSMTVGTVGGTTTVSGAISFFLATGITEPGPPSGSQVL
jgi:hypothetical protein